MNIGLIVAAGRGRRFSGPIPKQYRELDEQPILRRTVATLLKHPTVDAVQVVIHPADRELYRHAMEGMHLLPPVVGGGTRQESVYLGLESLAPLDPEKVIIHDAVRPFVEQETITAVLNALDRAPCAIAGLPVADTLKRTGAAGGVVGTVDRTALWRAQTPQGFRFKEILQAHRKLHREAPFGPPMTDDAMVAEQAGLAIEMVPGTEDNFKITTTRDLLRAEVILQRGHRETHTGWGFDSQKIQDGSEVLLCGIPVALSAQVITSQNRDVALNAVVNAMLGTVGGLQDEQTRLPPSAKRHLCNAENLLREAVSIVAMAGGQIEHVHLTVISDHEDITSTQPAMVRRLALLLSVPERRVAVDFADSTELGLMLRAGTLAAQCIATMNYPRDLSEPEWTE